MSTLDGYGGLRSLTSLGGEDTMTSKWDEHSMTGAEDGLKLNFHGSGEIQLTETLFAVLREGKQALMARISDYGEKELMGAKWTEASVALSFELQVIFEQYLSCFVGKVGDIDIDVKKNWAGFQEEILKQTCEYVRLCRFLEIRGVVCNKQLLFQEDFEAEIAGLDEEQEVEVASGNSEDETWDGQKPLDEKQNEDVRGGMKTFYNKEEVMAKIQEEKTLDQEGVRGGAGGAATTARKQQIRDALKEMASMVNDLPDTQVEQSDEDEVLEKIMKDMCNLAEAWKNKRPNKEQMQIRLSHLAERLDKSIKTNASTAASGSKDEQKQSFYANFGSNFQKADFNMNERKPAGKGKGGKGKPQEVMRTLPRFDLRKAWPQKEMSTWHIVLRDLELGKEPHGAIALCDSIERMVEIQTLAKVHTVQKSIILVAKAEGKETHKNVINAKECLLPWQGNLAMSKAIVATSDGKEATISEVKPIQAKETRISEEKKVALRIMAVLKFVDHEMQEKLVQFPDLSLHLLGCLEELKECKTYGWSHDEDENVLVGYCGVDAALVPKMLELSGNGGIFIVQLKQDIVTRPPVTWFSQAQGETNEKFFERVMKLAKDEKVPLAWRRGGGLCLGILKEDVTERPRSWVCFGIPKSWGPISLKDWLENNQWVLAGRPLPPKGKNKGWFFQGHLPGTKENNYAYELFAATEEHEAKHIYIRKWEKVRVVDSKITRISGPKWWSKDNLHDDPIEEVESKDAEMEVSATLKFQPEIEKTQLDETQMEESEGKRKNDDTISQPTKLAKTTSKGKIHKLAGGQVAPGQGFLLDCGGRGDCGWRALSFMLGQANSQKKTTEELVQKLDVLAKTLRGKTTAHLIQRRDVWEPFWAVDPKWSHVTESGPPATDVSSFMEVIQRPLRWICGLSFAAVSQLQRVNIVIFKHAPTAEEPDKFKIIARFLGAENYLKLQIIPLVLDGGHYYAIRK